MRLTQTNKLIESLTAQEIFDKVATHLLTQKEQCSQDGMCRYRIPAQNLMCAAGCLIPDDDYYSDLEGNSWANLVSNNLVTDHHFDLIDDLQQIHDMSLPEHWYKALTRTAGKWELNVEVLENVNENV